MVLPLPRGIRLARVWYVEPLGARCTFAGMIKHDVRLDLRLPAVQRQELAALAAESGLSSADLVRLSVRWLLQHPGVLLGGDRPDSRAA
jgi:hypothetical protein